MKILCVSDTTRSLAFSSSIKELYGDVDLIVSAGDMPLSSYDYLTTNLNRDLFYVYGNHNLEEFSRTMDPDRGEMFRPEPIDPRFYGNLLDGKCIRHKDTGLLLAGLGGSYAYNGGQSQYTEWSMAWRIAKLLPHLLWNRLRYGRYLDVLVTHAPPFGIGDGEDLCHRGFRSFLRFIRLFHPAVLVHGHIHLFDENLPRESFLNDTKIVNVYGCYVVVVEMEDK